jgi:hypothetical protein
MNTERVKELIRELVGEMEYLRPREARERRRRVRDLEMLLILSWLWQCPLAAAKDLEGFVEMFKLSKVHSLLNAAVDGGLVVCVRQGRTLEVQGRFFLDLKGIYQVRDHYRIPLEWQVTEEGVKWLVQRLRMVEAFYRLLPGLWQSGALAGPVSFFPSPDPDSDPLTLDDRMRLVGFRWTRQGPAHSVAQYRTCEGHDVWMPAHLYGIHHNDKAPGDLGDLFKDLDTSADFWHQAPASPPGLVIVATDPLAAYRAKHLYAPALPKAVVSPEGRIFRPMQPSCPMGSVNGTGDPPGRLGKPAKVAAWLEKPERSAMNGVTHRKAVEWVESWPGSLMVDVAEGVSQPRSKTAEILESLKFPLEDQSKPDSKPRRLVQEFEESRLYLGTAGMLAASRRDRVSYNAVKAPLGSYLNPEGRWRRNQMDHNAHVAKLAGRFRKGEGMFVAPGWRLVINYPDLTQIAPDMWLQVPWEESLVVWHCVEYEQSAEEDGDIDDKLNTYRTAKMQSNDLWLVLMICRTRAAADRFLVRGDDLPMLVAVYGEVMDKENHGFYGEASVWRYRGARVDIDHLVGPMVDGFTRLDLFELADGWAEGDAGQCPGDADGG